jgi:hypothetical protein
MKKAIFHSAILLAALSAAAQAQTTVVLSGESAVGEANYAPAGQVFASTEQTHDAGQNPVDQAMGWRWDDEVRREIAQTFYSGPQEVSFDRITFKTGGASLLRVLRDNPKIAFRLSIYRVPTAKSLPSDPEAELVSEQVGNFAGFASDRPITGGNIQETAHNYISFAFKPVTLEPDTYYAVALSFVQGGPGYAIPLAQNANNSETYTDGTGAFVDEGGVWKNCHDFYFYAEAGADKAASSR